MPTKDRLWMCTACTHEETQPTHATAVRHRCPLQGGRLVKLVAPATLPLDDGLLTKLPATDDEAQQ